MLAILHVCIIGACYLYGRSFNPTVRYLGRQLAALEGTEAGYAVSSGLGAISATLLQLCYSGDHIVAASAVYGVHLCQPAILLDQPCMRALLHSSQAEQSKQCERAGGTFALLKSFLPAKCGIHTTFVDIADLDAVKAAITDKTKVW